MNESVVDWDEDEAEELPISMEADLLKSGLVPKDMFCRELTAPERAATRTPHSVKGYVIPYYDIRSRAVAHYRVKLFQDNPKYKQPKDSGNHVYFPPTWNKVAYQSDKPYIILTEGEKKAALACKLGYPCCALGGVDSWRNYTYTLPADTVELDGDIAKITLDRPTMVQEGFWTKFATGLDDLINMLRETKKQLIIIYDTDDIGKTSVSVQQAAASLAFELRYNGVDFRNIRQLILPNPHKINKMGLDDLLTLGKGQEILDFWIKKNLEKRTTFPRHPQIREHIAKRLQMPKLARKEYQQISLSVISELDASGIRMQSKNDKQPYYFDYKDHQLMPADVSADATEMSAGIFGQFMYRKFGLGAPDNKINEWISTQFTGEEPLEDVDPFRVIARTEPDSDTLVYQLSDGQFAVVSGDGPEQSDKKEVPGLQIFDNGEKGILFEAGQVQPLDTQTIVDTYAQFHKDYGDRCVPFWWGDVLSEVRLRDKNKLRIVAALLFYISPWLYRWRGTQLPMEMILGEAGSGKSTLYELRLGILTGDPKLRNAPSDLKDWSATLRHSGGLHVTDNFGAMDRSLKARLSDEICRLVTEPNPSIESRLLYTNADVYTIPVRSVFGLTAITQPFTNQDILQRSIIIGLDKMQGAEGEWIRYDSFWRAHQLKRFGGREGWISHHLYVIHRFFELIPKEWKHNYSAIHRLINFEQALITMAKVFGIDGSWIPEYLSGASARVVVESDYAFQGLITWANMVRGFENQKNREKLWVMRQISEWAEVSEEFKDNEMLTNTRKLGRYYSAHRSYLMEVAGICDAGTINGVQRVRVRKPVAKMPVLYSNEQ